MESFYVKFVPYQIKRHQMNTTAELDITLVLDKIHRQLQTCIAPTQGKQTPVPVRQSR
jgi:hypothetical protein